MIFYVTYFQRKYKTHFYLVSVVYFAKKTLKILPPVYFTGLAVYFLCFKNNAVLNESDIFSPQLCVRLFRYGKTNMYEKIFK